MSKNGFIIALVTLCCFVDSSYGEVIRYTDKNGTLCFADDLGKVPAQYRHNIIRDEEESAAQIIDSQNESQELGSISSNTFDPDVVYLCYDQQLYSLNGRDMTDLLAARNYKYQTLDVFRNPENIKKCGEIYCIAGDEEKSKCLKRYNWMIEKRDLKPMYLLGNKMHYNVGSQGIKSVDLYFKVDPNTPFKW